jgi:hypothetical protein
MKYSIFSFLFLLGCGGKLDYKDTSIPNDKTYPDATIFYHGGSVISGTTNIYFIYYGNWNQYEKSKELLTNFIPNLNGSNYFSINSTYYSELGGDINYASKAIEFAGSIDDNYSLGSNISQNDVKNIVFNSLSENKLPLDTNGIYIVLSSDDVKMDNFCSTLCGWHWNGNHNNSNIKFAWIGNSISQCPNTCGRFLKINGTYLTPNNDFVSDSIVSVMAHEISETITDPDLNAWYDSKGNEMGGLCAWNFGTPFYIDNGAQADIKLKDTYYLIQKLWVNENYGYCGLSK